MNSLGGSISNFKDAVYRLQESLGKNLLPTMAEMVRGVTSVVKVFDSLSPGMKSMIAWSVALGAGGAKLNTMYRGLKNTLAELVVVDAITSGGMATQAVKAEQAAAATANLTTRMTGLQAALALIASPVGLFTTLAAVIGTTAYVAIKNYEEEQKKLAQHFAEESHSLQKAVQDWRLYRDAINEALKAKGGQIEYGGKLQAMLNQINAEMGKLTPREVAMEFKSKGFDLPKLEEEAGKAKQKADELKGSMESVRTLFREVSSVSGIDPNKSFNIPGMMKYLSPGQNFTKEQIQEIVDLFGKEEVTLNEVKDKMAGLNVEYAKQSQAAALLDAIVQKWDSYSTALDNVIEKQKGLQSFFQMSDKIGTIDALNEKMKVLDTTMTEMQTSLQAQGLPTDEKGLLSALGKSNNDEEKKQIESVLSFYAEYRNTKKSIAQLEIKDLEEAYNKRGQLQKQKASEEVELYRQEADKVKDIPEMRAEVEHKLSVAMKKAHDERIKDSKDTFEADLQARKDYIQKTVGMNQMSEDEQVKAWDRIKKAVEKFQVDNAKLIKASPELQKKVKDEEQAAIMGGLNAQKAGYDKHLKDLNEKASQYLDARKVLYRNDTQAEIDGYNTVIKWYEEAVAKKIVKEKEGNDEILKIRNNLNDATRKQAEENLKLQTDVETAKKDLISSDIDLLVKQAEAGQDVHALLIRKSKERLALELAIIDAESKAKIEAAGNTEKAKDAIMKIAEMQRVQAMRTEATSIESILKSIEAKQKEVQSGSYGYSPTGGSFKQLSGFGTGTGGAFPSMSGFSGWIGVPDISVPGIDMSPSTRKRSFFEETSRPRYDLLSPDTMSAGYIDNLRGAMQPNVSMASSPVIAAGSDMKSGAAEFRAGVKEFAQAIKNMNINVNVQGGSSGASAGQSAVAKAAQTNYSPEQSNFLDSMPTIGTFPTVSGYGRK